MDLSLDATETGNMALTSCIIDVVMRTTYISYQKVLKMLMEYPHREMKVQNSDMDAFLCFFAQPDTFLVVSTLMSLLLIGTVTYVMGHHRHIQQLVKSMNAAVKTESNNFDVEMTTAEEEIEQKECRQEEFLSTRFQDLAPNHAIMPNAKVDKSDPRTNQHFVKFVKHRGVMVKLWECSICGREFQHQYMLRRHLPGHTDERNYHCLVCGKSFRQLSTLSQHRTIHSLARPHTCMICGKNFNRISTLISHRKTHLDEKPFKCHICHKGFHQKGNLRNHLFSHTNERPYRCHLCNKGFNQQSNLTCHLKKIHPGSEKSIAKIKTPTTLTQPLVLENPTVDMPFSMDISNGIIVDSVNTPEMDEILQKNQVPFALLKHNGSRPVLVKIFSANVPKGKNMLVPVKAEDLINGGKLILRHDQNYKNTTTEYFDASSPLIHLQVPLVAVLDSYISPEGHHKIFVHSPSSYTDDKTNSTNSVIKIEEYGMPQENYVLHNNQNDCPEYTVKCAQEKHGLQEYKEIKPHPMGSTPSKDPVLNDAQHIGEGSGLVRPAVQFGSPQYLLDPQGPPSYATDYDCKNLELFEPLECIDAGKIKHEMTSGGTNGDGTW